MMKIVKLAELYDHYAAIPNRSYDQQAIYELLAQIIFWGRIILPVVAFVVVILLVLNVKTYKRYKAYLKQCENIRAWQGGKR